MKKVLIVALIAIFFSSCSKESLEPEPPDLLKDAGFGIYSNLVYESNSLLSDVVGYVTPDSHEYAIAGFFTGSRGISIVDLADPYTPTEIARISTVDGFDMKIWKHYVYTVDGSSSTSGGGIVDISDPANPIRVGAFPSAHNIFITNDGYMIAEVTGLKIYDLNPNPTSPQLVFYDGTNGGHDAVVVGDRLYDFHGGFSTPGFTRIYDFSDPSNPNLLTEINDPAIQYHHSGAPTEDGNYLFICDELAFDGIPDITVWDISNLDNPEKVASYDDTSATVHNLYVRGNYAYVSYYTAGMKIFDISDPLNMTVVYEFDMSDTDGEGYNRGGAFGLFPDAPDHRVYVSDFASGLWVFKFDPARLQANLYSKTNFITES